MGIGDELIASGHALGEHRSTGKRVRIVGQKGETRWSDLWWGLDWIAAPSETGDFATVRNGPGCRPYIRYPWKGGTCHYSGWRCRDNVGAIRFKPGEVAFAEDVARQLGAFVVIEPNLAATSNQNKQWRWDRWQRLVALLPEVSWIQPGPPGTRVLNGVRHVSTADFRHAAAVLDRAVLSAIPEGALHHAAGALRRPAIVLYGGTVDENSMGYPWHDNIVDQDEGSPCGSYDACDHCAEAWARLTPEHVAERVAVVLKALQ